MNKPARIRVATYNIHKSRGLDRQVNPARVVKVLRELNADIIALQEVVCLEGGVSELNQGRFFADTLSYHYHLGETRRLHGAAYGNVVLSRAPIRAMHNYDLTWRRHERRACLRIDIELPCGHLLHVFNVHLGLTFGERRHQARKLVGADILGNTTLTGTRVMLGDFNDWARGLPSRLLATHLESVDIHHHLGRRRTYPGVLPLIHLDHIYFDPTLQLEQLVLHRSPTALIASDHVPLVAEFSFVEAKEGTARGRGKLSLEEEKR
jgi:endonuclease/exonuclease/phosphatase family metal-dependent hydrolase